MNRMYNENNYNNKYNLDPKYVRCAGCSKPAEPRWSEYLGQFLAAYWGPNNTELCCKCIEKHKDIKKTCFGCGKKGQRRKGNCTYGMHDIEIEDKDNPSGKWIRYCCNDCLPEKYRVRINEGEEMVWEDTNKAPFSEEGTFEKIVQGYEKAQNYWNSLSSSEREKEYERIVENMKLGRYGDRWGNEKGDTLCAYWVHNQAFWKIENGKYVSDKPHLAPFELAMEFTKKDFKENDLVPRDYELVVNDKSKSSPNPAAPTPQLITNSNSQNDNSVSPTNSPKPNPGKDNSSETKNDNNVKTIKFENKGDDKPKNPASNEKPSAKNDDKILVINLKNIKRIIFTEEGNLIIEFKNEKSENSSEIGTIQKITSEEINKSQELQNIKDYCQKNGKSSLSGQELNNLIQGQNNSVPTNSTENSGYGKAVWISVGIGAALIVGVVIGLLMKPKRTLKKEGQKIKK